MKNKNMKIRILKMMKIIIKKAPKNQMTRNINQKKVEKKYLKKNKIWQKSKIYKIIKRIKI